MNTLTKDELEELAGEVTSRQIFDKVLRLNGTVPTPIPAGREWWTQGLHGWHAEALHHQQRAAELQAALDAERAKSQSLQAKLDALRQAA